jgi:GWxTD domain-containing protein
MVTSKPKQSLLYQPSSQIVHPEFRVFHSSDSSSLVYIKINLDELLFNNANPENKLQAQLKFQYTLRDITKNPNNNELKDSSTFIRKLDWVTGKNIVVLNMPVKAEANKKYLLSISIYDILREAGQQNYIIVNKLSRYTAQNIKLANHSNNLPLFTNYVTKSDSVRIIINQSLQYIYIKYRKDDTPVPPPPFSSITEPTFAFVPDSSWVMPYNNRNVYCFPLAGFYLIQTDSAQSDGLLLANFGNSYPKVKDITSMIPPIEYLSTSEEFRNIKNSENEKLAVDNFWLRHSENVEVGRELIRIYYNRTYYSNLFFTSYKPGWKTDRGMIYMIFGPPSLIRKTATTETWEYYIRQDASNLTINFNRTDSPYSDNHYVLQRDELTFPFWRAAVDSWRRGKVFSLEE